MICAEALASQLQLQGAICYLAVTVKQLYTKGSFLWASARRERRPDPEEDKSSSVKWTAIGGIAYQICHRVLVWNDGLPDCVSACSPVSSAAEGQSKKFITIQMGLQLSPIYGSHGLCVFLSIGDLKWAHLEAMLKGHFGGSVTNKTLNFYFTTHYID